MSDHIFISYASENRDFAMRLADSLEPFYPVWIDRERLHGGLQWEQNLAQAIEQCGLFLVIVSKHSNDSKWVTRETIRAEDLNKFRIPILLKDDLPLRLLELQYIDFRASYEGGLSDLLDTLKLKLDTADQSQKAVERILGAGLRAYLLGNIPEANSLFNQVSAVSPALSAQVSEFWETIASTPHAQQLATQLMPRISTSEEASVSQAHRYADATAYEWSLQLVADAEVLDQVSHVIYDLHETFNNPRRTVRDRRSNFRLSTVGWGVFMVKLAVHFVDGSVGHSTHMLTFETEDE